MRSYLKVCCSCFVLYLTVAFTDGFSNRTTARSLLETVKRMKVHAVIVLYQPIYQGIADEFLKLLSSNYISATSFPLGASNDLKHESNRKLLSELDNALNISTMSQPYAFAVLMHCDLVTQFHSEMLKNDAVHRSWLKHLTFCKVITKDYIATNENDENYADFAIERDTDSEKPTCFPELSMNWVFVKKNSQSKELISAYETATYSGVDKAPLCCHSVLFKLHNESDENAPFVNLDSTSLCEIDMVVGTVESDIFFEERRQRTGVEFFSNKGFNDIGKGIDSDLLEVIANRLQVSIDSKVFNPSSDDEKESWKMLIDKLLHREIDIAVGKIPLQYEMLDAIEYSTFYYEEHYVIMCRSFSSPAEASAVFKPLRPKVWMVLLIMMVLSGPLFLAMIWLSGVEHPYFTFDVSGILNSSFHTFGLFFGSSTWSIQNLGISFFSLMWLFAGLIIMVGYNSVFIASITSSKNTWEIDNLEDLLYAIKKENAILVLDTKKERQGPFQDLSDTTSIYAKIYDSAKKRNALKFMSIDELGNSTVLEDNNALVIDLTYSNLLMYKLKDDSIHISSQRFGRELYGIAVRKGFRFLSEFNDIISILHENGLLLGIKKRIFKGKSQLRPHDKLVKPVLTLNYLTGAFIFYGSGMTVSVLLMLLEIIFHQSKKCMDSKH